MSVNDTGHLSLSRWMPIHCDVMDTAVSRMTTVLKPGAYYIYLYREHHHSYEDARALFIIHWRILQQEKAASGEFLNTR